MFSHITAGVSDFERSLAFYTPLMRTLGLVQKFCDRETPMAAWMAPDAARPLFIITTPYDKQPVVAGNGQMAAFLAAARPIVDQCHAQALMAGGTCEGPPGLRPHYHPHYYGAYFRDPDGNKICVCCHEPA